MSWRLNIKQDLNLNNLSTVFKLFAPCCSTGVVMCVFGMCACQGRGGGGGGG